MDPPHNSYGTQINSLLQEMGNLEKEVHCVKTQKEALRSEVERSNQENARLANELLQVLALESFRPCAIHCLHILC